MAITLVASASPIPSTNNGVTSSAVTTTGATLLVISAAWYNGFVFNITVSDSKANTWIGLPTHVGFSGTHQLWYCLTPIVGTGHTFTIGPGSTYSALIAYAFAGVASYQTQSGVSHGDAPSPAASGSVTPSAAGALVLTGMASNNAATDTVAPGGFTQTTVPAVGGVNMQNSAAYLVQSPAAAINPTWSWTGSHTWIGVSTAVFLPAISAAVETVQPFVWMPA